MYLYLSFVFGELIHIFKRSSMSNAVPGSASRSLVAFIGEYWNLLLMRALIALAAFVGWVDHPQAFDDLVAKYLGQNLDLALPHTKFVGICLGFLSDSVLDWIVQKAPLPDSIRTWLKQEVPSIPDNGADNH